MYDISTVALHVKHDPHPSTVALSHQGPQVRFAPKVRVNLVDILLPVAMVTVIGLHRNWRDPNGVCSKSLDVVEFPGDTGEGSAAVGTEVRTGRAGILVLRKPVREQLYIVGRRFNRRRGVCL